MIFKFLKHGSALAYRLTVWFVLIFVLLAGAAVVALRFHVLPNADSYRDRISQSIALAIGQSVEIGRIEGNWRDFRPHLKLLDVQIHEAGGLQTLAFERVDTALSWRSLVSGNIVFRQIELAGPELEIRRDSLGTLWIAGTPILQGGSGSRSGMAEWLIKQEQIVVRDARIAWIDEMRSAPTLVIEDVTIEIENSGSDHRFAIAGAPPVELASAVKLSAEFSGRRFRDLASWEGRIFGGFEYANLSYARQWITLPVKFESDLGLLSVWIDVSDRKVTQVVAEGNLVNVSTSLAPQTQSIALKDLSGRLQWNRDAAAETIEVSRLTLETADGVRLPPTSIFLRRPLLADRLTELKVRSLELGPLSALSSSLPLDEKLVEQVARFQPTGRIDEMTAKWIARENGKHAYEIVSKFAEISVVPVDRMPGFSGLSGTATLSAAGGTMSLSSENAALVLPDVLPEPVAFAYLNGDADWQIDNDRLSVNFRNVSFSNDHAAGSVNGTYQFTGVDKGDIDLRAVLVRGEAQHVWRYFPHVFPKVHAWLKQGLLAGKTEDARLHLAGPLHKFPFADGDGIFEIKVAAQDAAVRIQTGWPTISGISGDFLVNRNRIDILPRSGSVMGVDVSDTRVSISGLGSKDEHVIVKGNAAGGVDQFLQFVAASPVDRYTRGVTASMSGDGSGRLALKMDLPLRRPLEVTVDGSLDISGQNFIVGPRVPVLRNFTTRIDFSRDGVILRDGRAQALGGNVEFASLSSPTGTMEVGLSGSIATASLAAFTRSPMLGRLYGESKWNGRLSFRKGLTHLRAESSLVGVGSRLPAPLHKQPDSALLMKFDLRSTGKREYEYALDLANLANARWVSRDAIIGRGAIKFGGIAKLPPSGRAVSLSGNVAVFDLDGWRSFFGREDSQIKAGNRGKFDEVDLKVGKLRAAGRLFSDLSIDGMLDAGNWTVLLAGPQVEGIISVSPGTRSGTRINARFATLAVPPRETVLTATRIEEEQKLAPRKLPPALNAVVEDLRFEGKLLGRLELLAEPNEDKWKLERLAISNPDGRMDMKGQWQMTGRPRTEYVARVEAFDIGRFFSRLGYGETIVGGSGTLIGPVSWLGDPFHPDLPTLNGKLKLNAIDGRFAQVDPGAAQLLGILSLQAFPRRITLDFKDVFVTGFSFDSITANMTISDGIVQTQDFQMDGVAAQVTMKGLVNLAAETQIINVHVRPQLSSAAAVAGAVVVSPIAGVAAFLVQKALGDPVEQAASRDYHVTGAWNNPRIERVIREPVVPDTPAKGGR